MATESIPVTAKPATLYEWLRSRGWQKVGDLSVGFTRWAHPESSITITVEVFREGRGWDVHRQITDRCEIQGTLDLIEALSVERKSSVSAFSTINA